MAAATGFSARARRTSAAEDGNDNSNGGVQAFEIETPIAPQPEDPQSPSLVFQVSLVVILMCSAMSLNFFMKHVFSGMKLVANAAALKGVTEVGGLPAPFFWTVTQQVVAFFLAILLVLGFKVSGGKCGYKPPLLKSGKHWVQVCLLGVFFAVSIGLNNFSLSLVTLTVNNMIRATSPFTTAIAVTVIQGNKMTFDEWMFMIIGTAFVIVNVLAAKPEHIVVGGGFVLGTILAFVSTLGGALMFIIVELFGQSAAKLNSIDLMFYMSLPPCACLAPFLFAYPHISGADWADGAIAFEKFTDLELLGMVNGTKVWIYCVISGFLAFLHNALQFFCVQRLSPVQTAFASNMSKAITVLVSFIFLEEHSSVFKSVLLLSSAAGGLACFACFTLTKIRNKAREKSMNKIEPGAVRALTHKEEIRKFVLFLALGGAVVLLGGLAVTSSKPHPKGTLNATNTATTLLLHGSQDHDRAAVHE